MPGNTHKPLLLFSLMPLKRGISTLPVTDMVAFIKSSEKCGLHGVLLPESNEGSIDVWAFGQMVLMHTKTMSPFIAVNPNYMHPFAVAKKIATLTSLYGRKLYINFITGTAKDEALDLGLEIKQEDKYKRLVEYIEIITRLLTSREKFSHKGTWYTVKNLRLTLQTPLELFPEFYLAGESAEAIKAAATLNCYRLSMAHPRKAVETKMVFTNEKKSDGFHAGILARPTNKLALVKQEKYYTVDRMNQLLVKYSMAGTAAAWKMNMYKSLDTNSEDPCFSLQLFKNGYSDLPYLVGDYKQLAEIILNYQAEGLRTLILEVPDTGEDEFKHVLKVIKQLNLEVEG